MEMQFALDDQRVITLHPDRVKSLATEIANAAARAAKDGSIVRFEVPSLNWSKEFTAAEAKRLAQQMELEVAKLPAREEEERRASGYSPISEEIVLTHDGKGEIVGMSKRLRF